MQPNPLIPPTQTRPPACLPAHKGTPQPSLRTIQRRPVTPLRAGRRVIHVRQILRLLARRLRRGRETGFFPSAFQRRHPAMASLAGGVGARAAFDAVGIIVVCCCAGEGADLGVVVGGGG